MHPEVLDLCVDTIAFTDSSDHHHNGKAAFGQYLKDTPPPTSRWEEPFSDAGGVTVHGEVQKMYMWWKVSVHFTFSGDKIATIKITRK